MRPKHTLLKLLGLLVAFALVAAACGSDTDSAEDAAADIASEVTDNSAGSDEDSADESATDEVEEAVEAPAEEAAEEEVAADETDDAESAADAGIASGDPVLVGWIGTATIAGQDAFDAMTDGFDAATIGINSDGGIDGRPIEVVVCDDLGDPNLSVECAQELIDAGVVSFVGNFSPFGAAINPVIAEAGLAVIGGGLYTPGDFGVESLYATNGGAFTAGAGGPVACVLVGGTQLGLFHNAGPTGEQVIPLVEGFVTGPRDGVDLVAVEPIALDQADFAPAVAKVLGANPDCITAGVSLPLVPPLIEALRAQGYDGRIQVPGDFNTPDRLIAALGENANNLVLADIYDQTSAGYADYVSAVAEVTGDDSAPLPLGVMAWLGLHVAADIMREVGTDAATITSSAPEVVVGYDTGGLTATPLDWSVPGENPLGITNLRDTSLTAREIVDGEVVFTGEWVPIFGG